MAETTDREKQAATIIQRHAMGAIAAGALPMPLVDLAAITGTQMNMARSLAKLYEIPFSQELSKSIIVSLVGGSFSVASASLLKFIPVAGQLIGSLSVPVFAGASTYAIGKVFVQHFESGGTFLTLDPKKVKEYYAREFNKGEEEAKKSYVGVQP